VAQQAPQPVRRTQPVYAPPPAAAPVVTAGQVAYTNANGATAAIQATNAHGSGSMAGYPGR
jgi:hypothetical protein